MENRALTQDERAVLLSALNPDLAGVWKCDAADIADRWWAHAQSVEKLDAEAALAAKIKRWRPAYEAAIEAGNYQTRAEREAAA